MAQSDLRDAIAFISTYPPRQCGIATFTRDVVQSVTPRAEGRLRSVVLAVHDTQDGDLDYPEEVVYQISQYDEPDYVRAAEYLNFNKVRAVSVQHEFGIYGGPDGAYLLDFLRELRCPIIVTLHTILDKPSPGQRAVMDELIVLSSRIVVMSHKAIGFLTDIYDAPPEKLRYVPHGVPDIPLVEPDGYKAQFDLRGRIVMLTFGLLGPGKGIEGALKALPAVVKQYPEFCYVVLGATHPNIVREHGESYRLSLQRLARELGLQRNVLFTDQYVDTPTLCEFLKAADFYCTPYLNREQITSGTLAYALGAGKPIVSTRYWHAEELLDEGRGVLVDFDAPDEISAALLELLDTPSKLREMRANAYEHARSMTWPSVGGQYLEVFREAISVARVVASMPDVSMRYTLPITGLPRPRLDHVQRMTDDTGIFQHARYAVPDRAHGYCTDDVSRALVVASKYYDAYRDSAARGLLDTYLSFMAYAQRDDGLFHNFMGYDRRFLDEVGSDDCFGRALWGLGYTMYRGPRGTFQLAKELFERALVNLGALNLRGRAYAMIGLYYYMQRYPESEDVIEKIDRLAAAQCERFEAASHEDWPWFEDAVTYGNASIPQSLFLAYEVTGQTHYRDVAERSIDFLLDLCVVEGRLSLVGNDGWHQRGDAASGGPTFDQQPIDACGLVEACKVAFRLTGRRRYLTTMRTAFDWFLGVNDVGQALYDFKTGGCADGLHAAGVNLNQGAESTLANLLALLTLYEVFSEQDRSSRGTAAHASVAPVERV
jgi:glycosyltransferase involved in cell wall biosynthesis